MEKIKFSNKELSNFWTKFLLKSTEAEENNNYVEGHNPKLFNQPKKHDPDNRIPVPLAKIAVEDLAGYAGRAGDRHVSWPKEGEKEGDELDEFQKSMQEIYKYNEEAIETSELYLEGNIQGVGYEILWTSTELSGKLPSAVVTPEFKKVSCESIIIDYSNDLKPKKNYALHFSHDSRVVDGNIKKYQVITVYWPLFADRYERLENTSNWSYEEDYTEYPYQSVPVVPFRINPKETPLFQAEKPIIDAHDSLISKSVNEVDRFNAMIMLFPGEADKEFRDKLKEVMAIDNLEGFEKWPQYLQKNLSGISDFYSNLAKKLDSDFHKSVKVPDMSDENFASNQSGVAMAYKVLGMEFKAALIDTYFNQGIIERDNLIKDVFNIAGINTDEYHTVIRTKRNLPVDEAAKMQIALQMLSLEISQETILKFLPKTIIEDAQAEIDKMNERKEEENQEDDTNIVDLNEE